MNQNNNHPYTTAERDAAQAAVKRANMIRAGFVISHITHCLSQMGKQVMAQWEKEGDEFVKELLKMGFPSEAFNAMVEVQAFHPVAFQYGKRFYYN